MILYESWFYVCIVFGLFVYYFKNYMRACYVATFETRGPTPLPFLGNALIIKDSKKLEYYGTNLNKLYGAIPRAWVSFWPIFFIVEPAHLQIVLGNTKYTSKSLFYTALHNFIGPGLASNSGEKWKNNRKLIQPYFNINMFTVFYDTFSDCSLNLVKNLKNHHDVNITKFLNKLVLNSLQEVILGVPSNASMKDCPFRQGQITLISRIASPWLLLDSIFHITKAGEAELNQKYSLQGYIRKILEERKTQLRNNNANLIKTNLMDMFIEIAENNNIFKEDDVVNEIATFMLAGQDSVAAGLAFSFFYIAKQADVQQKIVDEMREILGKSDRQITFEDINQMRYLEQCVKEALRLCPSVPMISRKLPEDVSFGKITLPEGTTIMISPFATHRLPHVFPDPLKYDPDRFSPENSAKMHPYAFIPFSAGPRNCIGYRFSYIEMKTVIAHVLREFDLSLTPGHEELNLSYGVTLRASGGIWLRLKKREGFKVL